MPVQEHLRLPNRGTHFEQRQEHTVVPPSFNTKNYTLICDEFSALTGPKENEHFATGTAQQSEEMSLNDGLGISASLGMVHTVSCAQAPASNKRKNCAAGEHDKASADYKRKMTELQPDRDRIARRRSELRADEQHLQEREDELAREEQMAQHWDYVNQMVLHPFANAGALQLANKSLRDLKTDQATLQANIAAVCLRVRALVGHEEKWKESLPSLTRESKIEREKAARTKLAGMFAVSNGPLLTYFAAHLLKEDLDRLHLTCQQFDHGLCSCTTQLTLWMHALWRLPATAILRPLARRSTLKRVVVKDYDKWCDQWFSNNHRSCHRALDLASVQALSPRTNELFEALQAVNHPKLSRGDIVFCAQAVQPVVLNEAACNLQTKDSLFAQLRLYDNSVTSLSSVKKEVLVGLMCRVSINRMGIFSLQSQLQDLLRSKCCSQ